MLPCLPIPRSVTTLYVFAMVNLMALLNFTLVDADIMVLDRQNRTLAGIPDLPAAFGPSLPDEGFWGRVAVANPPEACGKIDPPPSTTTDWIALIRRSDCNFDFKVLNAQEAGFAAAIVYNNHSDRLITMHGGKYSGDIKIYSVFIGGGDGQWLEEELHGTNVFALILDTHEPLNPNLYLLPFAIVVGVCFIVMVIFMIVKWVLSIRRRQRSRLSRANLNKIPTKKFQKGDPYDVCAICLDEYEEGEKLRILPCAHAYHQKCIDPWLTKNKKTCPLCKKKVIPGEPDSSSEEESDGEETNERAPLLGATSRPTRGGTFNNSGLPSAMREEVQSLDLSDSDDSYRSPNPSTSIHHSSVEVHHTPRLHRNGAPDYSALCEEGRTDSSDLTESSSDQSADLEEQGAVGGQASFQIVEDHFTGDRNQRRKKNRRKRRAPAPLPDLEVQVVSRIGNIQDENGSEEDHDPSI